MDHVISHGNYFIYFEYLNKLLFQYISLKTCTQCGMPPLECIGGRNACVILSYEKHWVMGHCLIELLHIGWRPSNLDA